MVFSLRGGGFWGFGLLFLLEMATGVEITGGEVKALKLSFGGGPCGCLPFCGFRFCNLAFCSLAY